MGTLTLDEQNTGKTIEEVGAALIAKHLIPEAVTPVKTGKRIVTNKAVVLENAAHGFVRPNILDVKLGVQLWGNDAPEEKRIRFNKVTSETTHKDLGFRIAGMRVWQGHGAKGPDIDEEGFKAYNKDYGRFSLHKDNVHEAFQNFIFSEGAGIDEELGRLVAQAFLADVSRVADILEGQESRMYSSSLLFVFEGDGAALRAAMEEASRSPATMVNSDSENSEEDENDFAEPKIYSVKIIDFAHAEWTPGLGPDKEVIFGVRSIGKILNDLSRERL